MDVEPLANLPMKPVVIKIGGALLKSMDALQPLWEFLRGESHTVLVHGGGPQATALAHRLDHQPRIIQGRRVTSVKDLEIALYTMRGALNARLVASGLQFGIRTVGVSGIDGSLVCVSKRPEWEIDGETVDFGWVGDVVRVDVSLLNTFWEGGYTPVVAPLCADVEGNIYNVNADTVALEVAAVLNAEKLIFLAEAGGIRRVEDDPGSLVERLTLKEAESGVQDGWIQGGMRVKANVAREAITRGVEFVRVCDPAGLSQENAGTVISPILPHSDTPTHPVHHG